MDFAFQPDEIILHGDDAFGRMKGLLDAGQWAVIDTDLENNMLIALRGVDVLWLAAKLRSMGLPAEPNYALFAQGIVGPWGWGSSGSGAGPEGMPSSGAANPFHANPFHANPFHANPFHANPFHANPFHANPFHANPFHANPFHANPFHANPFHANPFHANPFHANACAPGACCCPVCRVPASPPPPPMQCVCCALVAAVQCSCWLQFQAVDASESVRSYQHTETGGSSAEPASDPGGKRPQGKRRGPKVIVVDTGLAVSQYLPALLHDLDATTADGDRDMPSEDGEPYLDPFAGHGTFVAGVIEQRAPLLNLRLVRVLNTTGVTFQWSLTQRLEGVIRDGVDDQTLINLSLSGFAPGEMMFLTSKLKILQDRGAAIVAAAGNDGSPFPTLPAAIPGVIGVGALDASGNQPAQFSNYGSWVRACAPGVNIVSSFFDNWNGPRPAVGGKDPDEFHGWACWSGTSFAAPAVTAALALEMVASKCTAQQAVRNIIDNPNLPKVHGLGTKVKL